MIVKVCGMRDGENIGAVAKLDVDWIGMVFWNESQRNVTMIPTHAGIIPDRANLGMTPSSFKRVGIFVDEMAQNIITRAVNFKLDIIQMNGHETPTLIRNLRRTLDPDLRPGIKFIKTIKIESGNDLAECKDYADCVDYFLFDTRSDEKEGATRHFDWSLTEQYDGQVPFLLSGGIGPEDAHRLTKLHHPMLAGIDINANFESEPGIKDIDKIRTFLEETKEWRN